MLKNYKWMFMIQILGLLFVGKALATQTHWLSDFYDKAGYIEIYEEEAVVEVGSLAPNDVLRFGLKDVALMMGHTCPGITTTSFILTKMALEELFKSETIRWGNIRIAASASEDIVNVAAYLSGIHHTNLLSDEPRLMVDKSLDPGKPGQVVMIFQRMDTGKMVRAEFNKMKLLSADEAKQVKLYKEKFNQGKASSIEIEKNGNLIQNVVKRAIMNPPAGVYSVKSCSEYHFPAL